MMSKNHEERYFTNTIICWSSMAHNSINKWLYDIHDNNAPLFFILGTCAIESEEITLATAEFLKKLSEKLQFKLIFKAAFDKANRTSVEGFRGCGMEEGLRILEKVKQELELPILTDVHETSQVEAVACVADVLQIPAMLCRQTDLLVACGKTGKPVHVKKGQFIAAENMKEAIKKVTSTGNEHVWLCERGFTFGYQNLVVDMRNFPIMKRFGKPVVLDATHSVQRPGGNGTSSAGDRVFVPTLLASAVVQGIAGIFMEVHPEPEKALSDGPNSVRLAHLENLLSYVIGLDSWAKSRPVPEIY